MDREMRKMIKPSSVLLTLCLVSNECIAKGRTISSDEDIELEREAAALNKHSVKTIKAEYGDIYDCVHINKQPAFDHPLLKDHKVKMRPSIALENTLRTLRKNRTENEDSPIKLLGLKEGCPEGSVPIRRTTKEDLIRAKSIFRRQLNHSDWDPTSPAGYDFPGIFSGAPPNELYKGVAARMNVYQPSVSAGQSSSALIMLRTATNGNVGSIQAGWTIDPSLYKGDTRTRLFIRWSEESDGKVAGCFNVLCSGFVIVNKDIPIDSVLSSVSIGPSTQVFHWMTITLDPLTQDWWLSMQDDNKRIGYWPNELFAQSGLSVGAPVATWGGLVHTTTDMSPPMGSGTFELGNYDTTCNMVNVQVDIGNTFVSPYDDSVTVVKSRCYLAGKQNTHPEYRFQFGGPGGSRTTCV